MNPWIPILRELNLSRTEEEVVKRFENDPSGRSFLPVADILRGYRYFDESLELLTYGVMHHPTFTVARIVLVRELLQKGLVAEAWRWLEEAKTSLRDNVLAQKLRFKLALLLGYDGIVRSTYRHLKAHQMMDPETARLGDILEMSGLAVARDRLVQEMKAKGVSLVVIDHGSSGEQVAAETDDSGGVRDLEEKTGLLPIPGTLGDRIGGFHVVTLDEVFHGDDEGQKVGGGGIELDSSTLASIYEHQGHFEKAISVYRRLLRLTPSNEFIKAKITELMAKKQMQRDDDLMVDPAIADSMEQIEVIDAQVRFFRSLLSRLETKR